MKHIAIQEHAECRDATINSTCRYQPNKLFLPTLSCTSVDPKYRPYTLLITFIILLIVMELFTFNGPSETIAKSVEGKQIVILCEGYYGLPVPTAIINSTVEELKRQGINRSDLFIEYLDIHRNNSIEYREMIIDLLQEKYTDKSIGLIINISIGFNSIFSDKWLGFLPGVPVLNTHNQGLKFLGEKTISPQIVLKSNKDVAGTLRYAFTLFPATQRLVVINNFGYSLSITKDEILNALNLAQKKLVVDFIDEVTYEKMLKTISTLPSNTVVLCGFFSVMQQVSLLFPLR